MQFGIQIPQAGLDELAKRKVVAAEEPTELHLIVALPDGAAARVVTVDGGRDDLATTLTEAINLSRVAGLEIPMVARNASVHVYRSLRPDESVRDFLLDTCLVQ